MIRSERRKKIIEMRNNGISTREIAKELNLSLNNINATVAHMIKLGYIPSFTHGETQERYQKYLENRVVTNPQIIIDLYKSGISKDSIARQVKETYNHVVKVLRGVRKQQTNEFKNKVIEVYNSGKTYREMQEILGCKAGRLAITVHRLVKEGKVKHRKG